MLQIQKKLSPSFYAIISLPSTAMGFALSVQISALSWLLTTKYNLDIHEVGIVWAAGPLAGIFGQVIIGLISDKVWFWGGRRRPFILIGGVLAASMLLALPNIDAIRSFFGIEGLLGVAVVIALTLDLAINVSFNPTRSIIADVTPEGNPRTRRGIHGCRRSPAFLESSRTVIGAVFGNYLLIYSGVVIVLIFSVLPIFFIAEERSLAVPEVSAPADGGKGSRPATKWGQLFRLYAAHAFSWIGVQTMFVYIIAFIQQKMTSTAGSSAVFSGQIISISFAVLNTVGFILPGFVLEPIAEKIGRVRTHCGCVAIMACGYFLIASFGTTPLMMYTLMGIVGIGWGAVVSLPFAIMSEIVDKSRMGFFMGIFNLSVVLPQLFVSLGLGILIQNASDKNIIFVISGISLALSAFFWVLCQGRKTCRSSITISPRCTLNWPNVQALRSNFRTANRIAILLLLAAGAVLVALSGCGPKKPERVRITIWHQDRIDIRVVLEAQLKKFMQIHPEVEVEQLFKETEQLRSGFIIAAIAGQGPEIVYGPADQVGPFQVMDIILPLDTLFPKSYLDQFDPKGLTYYKGHLYQIADKLGNHLTLVYNKKLVPKPPATEKELIEIGKSLTHDLDANGKPDKYGLAWNYTEPFFFIPFMTGFGGWVMDDSGKPALNNQGTVDGLKFIKDLRDKYKNYPE